MKTDEEDEYYSMLEDEDEYSDVKNQTNTIYSMYKIFPKNKELNYCYVGHTSNLSERNKHHFQCSTNTNNSKHHQLIYQTIYNNGGWNEWEMIEIEKYVCSTRLEARMREQQLILEHNANINTLSAFVTEDERKKRKQAITNKYRAENKDIIKEQTQKYKEDHKDIIKEQMIKYRKDHKEEIREKEKEYRQLHADKYKENDKIWREANKEILKEKRKIYEAKKKQKLLAEQLEKGI
jgi:hypothetical protein